MFERELEKREIVLREIFIEFAPDHSPPRMSNIYAHGKALFNGVINSLLRRDFMKEEFADEDNSFYYFTDLGRRVFSISHLIDILNNLKPKTTLKLNNNKIFALRCLIAYNNFNPSRLKRYGLDTAPIFYALKILLKKGLVSSFEYIRRKPSYYFSAENLKSLHKYLFELVSSKTSVNKELHHRYPTNRRLKRGTYSNNALENFLLKFPRFKCLK